MAPHCDADAYCRECVDSGDCPEGFECSANYQCVGCVSDAQCRDDPNGTQCVDMVGGKVCRGCDPLDNAGCEPGQKCWEGIYCNDP
jgi:Cys-rich repeat protein